MLLIEMCVSLISVRSACVTSCSKQNKWQHHHASSFPTIQLSHGKWSASDWAQFGIPTPCPASLQPPPPPTHSTQTPTPLTPTHAHCPHLRPWWTRSTSAQRISFSNFPWLRKQYTCLNNVDISNALKHSSNGALIGSKWIQDYRELPHCTVVLLTSTELSYLG